MARISPWAACRRRRWPCWWSANWPSARFVPEDYLEVVATFRPHGNARLRISYKGTWFRRLPTDRSAGHAPAAGWRRSRSQIVARARTGEAAIESIEAQTQRMPPPLLYDLTELQRHANRLFGFSAQKTLDIAQALYERHKLISYPRTDSRHLSQDVAATLPRDREGDRRRLTGEQLAPGTGERPLGRRFVDDAKVTDHHAIIPTTTLAAKCRSAAGRAQDLRPDLPPAARAPGTTITSGR